MSGRRIVARRAAQARGLRGIVLAASLVFPAAACSPSGPEHRPPPRPVYIKVAPDGRMTVDGKPLEQSRDPVVREIGQKMKRPQKAEAHVETR
jgi:hypothetical protein